MKKPFLCVLIFLFVFLFGCRNFAPPEINKTLNSSFKATCGDLYMEGIVISSDSGQFYIDYSTPDELNALSYSWDGGLTISYRGLNAVTQSEYLPDTAFPEIMRNIFHHIAISEIVPEKAENGRYMFKNASDVGVYTAFCDDKGNIESIELPSVSLKVTLIATQ